MIYKGNKSINDTAHPLEGSPAEAEGFICLCLLPDRTWHKVNDPKVDYREDLGEGKVEH